MSRHPEHLTDHETELLALPSAEALFLAFPLSIGTIGANREWQRLNVHIPETLEDGKWLDLLLLRRSPLKHENSEGETYATTVQLTKPDSFYLYGITPGAVEKWTVTQDQITGSKPLTRHETDHLLGALVEARLFGEPR